MMMLDRQSGRHSHVKVLADAFSCSYAQARARFLQVTSAARIPVESFQHPLQGLEGELLAVDVALDGDGDAASLLILSSGCHGPEGFCGSGIQIAALHDEEWRAYAVERGVAVLYIHALNPFGFSHIRRTTHENIDLNRNFQDFSKGVLPENLPYRELHPLMVPAHWPPDPENEQAIAQYIALRGEVSYQAAITGGQHEFPLGMFYGGQEPSWSNVTLRRVLRKYGRCAQRIAWIDIHTGLGPKGVGERIFTGRNDPVAIARAHSWWGSKGKTPVTSIYDGSSSSASLTGTSWTAVYDECPESEYCGIALEYGTVSITQVLQALRAEQWLNRHPGAPADLAEAIRRQVKQAFYVDEVAWQEQVVAQGADALQQAVDGLSAEMPRARLAAG